MFLLQSLEVIITIINEVTNIVMITVTIIVMDTPITATVMITTMDTGMATIILILKIVHTNNIRYRITMEMIYQHLNAIDH